jgi:hypothetical protein
MNEENEALVIPTIKNIKLLLDPINIRLENIETSLNKKEVKPVQSKYYRNQDLKKIFGLSSNTIIKYRETGILPYTKLGDIFLYDVKQIEKILIQNKVEL